MQLHIIDLSIIAFYLLATLGIAFYFSKRACKDLNSYFLAGYSVPWYMLAISNASGKFDISGTLWLIYLLFIYGLKSVWLPWLWPMFSQIFLMVYLSIWLRRSNAMTGGEWMTTRFGNGRGATLAHASVVIYAIISAIDDLMHL